MEEARGPAHTVGPEHTLGQRAGAEFVATFTLVFVAVGMILHAQGDLLAVAIAQGLAIAVMVAAVGGISGAHINPAVTFGLYLTQKIEGRVAGVYVAAQVAGATVAALLLKVALPGAIHGELGTPALGTGQAAGGTWVVSPSQGILVEGILTFVLVFVIFGTLVDEKSPFRSIAALAIGLTVTLDVLMGGPVSGAAMNPARWFGPALVSGTWVNAIVYLAGPIFGGGIAAMAYDGLILRPRESTPAV
jgi:MIP family channel proteins